MRLTCDPDIKHAATVNGHTLWRTGKIAFCSKCGHYSDLAINALKRPCTGIVQQSRLAGYNLMMRGRHPLTRKDAPMIGMPKPLSLADFEHWQARYLPKSSEQAWAEAGQSEAQQSRPL